VQLSARTQRSFSDSTSVSSCEQIPCPPADRPRHQPGRIVV